MLLKAAGISRILLENGDYGFKTDLDEKSVEVFGVPPHWYQLRINGYIQWSVELDVREWGIKEFVTSVQALHLYATFEDESGEEREEEYIYPAPPASGHDDPIKAMALEISGPTGLATVDTEWGSATRDAVYVSAVTIDLRKSQVQVTFS